MERPNLTPLDLSILLKDAGFPQDTERFWVSRLGQDPLIEATRYEDAPGLRCYAAPSPQELAEQFNSLVISYMKGSRDVAFVARSGILATDGDTMCEALALLYLEPPR